MGVGTYTPVISNALNINQSGRHQGYVQAPKVSKYQIPVVSTIIDEFSTGFITDNEWYDWLDRLTKKKTRVFFVCGACQSGTISDLPYKAIQNESNSGSNDTDGSSESNDLTVELAHTYGKKGDEDAERYSFKSFEFNKGVAISLSACRETEPSWGTEYTHPTMKKYSHGVFDQNLHQVTHKKMGPMLCDLRKRIADQQSKDKLFIPQLRFSRKDETLLNLSIWDFLDFKQKSKMKLKDYKKNNKRRVKEMKQKWVKCKNYTPYYAIAFLCLGLVAWYFHPELLTIYDWFFGMRGVGTQTCSEHDTDAPATLMDALSDPK